MPTNNERTGSDQPPQTPSHRMPKFARGKVVATLIAVLGILLEPLLGDLYARGISGKSGSFLGPMTLAYSSTAALGLAFVALVAYRYIWDPLGMMRESVRPGGKNLLSFLEGVTSVGGTLDLELWDTVHAHDIRPTPKRPQDEFWSRKAEVIGLAKTYAKRTIATYDLATKRSDIFLIAWVAAFAVAVVAGIFVPYLSYTAAEGVLILAVVVTLAACAATIGALIATPPLYGFDTWKAEVKALYYRDDAAALRKLKEWAEKAVKEGVVDLDSAPV